MRLLDRLYHSDQDFAFFLRIENRLYTHLLYTYTNVCVDTYKFQEAI